MFVLGLFFSIGVFALQPTAPPPYIVSSGALGAGNDLEDGNHTVAEAEARCTELHGCVGFTFAANASHPTGKVHAYFKSTAEEHVDGKWWTYLKPKSGFRFANTHGDHMVLQQSPAKAQIWGFAKPGSTITVTSTASIAPAADGTAGVTGVTAADGTWQVSMPAVKGSLKPATITATSSTAGTKPITMVDVLYGDVWFCAGQSNMQFTVASGFNASAEIAAAAAYPHVRLFTVADMANNVSQVELEAVLQPWSLASPKTVGLGNWSAFSAVCWFYGKELADTLGYPIGLIDSSWGGTRDEAWMDPEARALCNATAGARGGGGGEGEEGAERAAGAAEGIISAGSIVGNNDDVIVSSNNAADNGDVAKYPWSHRNVGGNVGPNTASALWNSMVHPFLRTAIYGAIWYQGEADCTGGYPMGNHYSSVNYACTFPALISSWRKHWHAGSNGATNAVFPFGFMQLSTWGDKANSTCGDGGSASCDVAVVRWGQTANVGTVPNLKMPETFMAVAVDLGDPTSPFGDIHPRYKKEMGQRLALSGRAVAYKDPKVPLVATTGPIAKKATVVAPPPTSATPLATMAAAPAEVAITFGNTGEKPLKIKHGVGFEVSAEACDLSFPNKVAQGTWFDAPVAVGRVGGGNSENNAVIISTAALGTAVAKCVRYNWYNAACMPALGPELCAIYGVGVFDSWLPAPPFILDVASHTPKVH